MKNIKLGKHKLVLFDDIEEMPIIRFHKYNKMLLIDAGIGSDLSTLDNHIEKTIRYLKSEKPDLASAELQNLRQNIWMIHSELTPKNLAFSVLIKSIDGIECQDLSDDGLRELSNKINDIKIKDLTATIKAVKKKINDQLESYFPKSFDDAETKEYYDLLKKRTRLILKSIIKGSKKKEQEDIERFTNELYLYNNPNVFSGTENIEIKYDKQFENLCLMLSQKLNVNAKKYTVLEFYNAFEYLKEQIKQKEKALRRK